MDAYQKVGCGVRRLWTRQDCAELTWGENVVRMTNSRVLLAAPLAVALQIVREAQKFGIEVHLSRRLTETIRYSRHQLRAAARFDANDFVGFIGDESSILKSLMARARSKSRNSCAR